MDEQKRRYLLVKYATEKFRLNPEYLSSTQRTQAEEEADKLYHLQNTIVSSKEAQMVQISTAQLMEAYLSCVQQFDTEGEFMSTLKKQGLTVEGFKYALRDELHCEKTLELISSDIPQLDREQALEYYEKNRLEFSRAKTWKLSQILITVNDEFAENRRANALARIKEVKRESATVAFPELALKYSECPSALEKGYLGWCEEGKLYPEITSALYKLKQGEISKPVETEVGFHLVKWEEEKPPYLAPFEEVWPFLQEKHASRARRYLQRQWISGLSG